VTPSDHDWVVEFVSTVDFAQAARAVTRDARRQGLIAPSFRCPPRLVGADRTIRRRGESAVVSVRLRGRPRAAVLADIIEGVVAANRLTSPLADRLRTELWDSLAPMVNPPVAGAA
jgi:hypothetical protein